MEPERTTGGLAGIFQTTATSAGGTLTEAEFFGAMRKITEAPPRAPALPVVSMGVVRRAWDTTDRLEARADALELEMARMRRWRWLRRRRVRRELGRALSGADALRRTFGPRRA